jgi:hypothetical protein
LLARLRGMGYNTPVDKNKRKEMTRKNGKITR